MLRFTVKYSIQGRTKHNNKTNVYLFNGAPAYNSANAKATALELVDAQKRIYPNTVEFMRVLIQDVDVHGKVIRGRMLGVPVDANGEFAIPNGDRLAGPGTVAIYEKNANGGRSGNQRFANCITSEELDQFTKAGTIPARFTARTIEGDLTTPTFAEQLMTAGSGQGLTMVLPDTEGDLVIGPRTITTMVWSGIANHNPNRVKTSTLTKRVKAFSQEIAALGRDARRVMFVKDGEIESNDQKALRYQLNLKAEAIWNSLTPEEKARVTWPEVFYHNPVNPILNL